MSLTHHEQAPVDLAFIGGRPRPHRHLLRIAVPLPARVVLRAPAARPRSFFAVLDAARLHRAAHAAAFPAPSRRSARTSWASRSRMRCARLIARPPPGSGSVRTCPSRGSRRGCAELHGRESAERQPWRLVTVSVSAYCENCGASWMWACSAQWTGQLPASAPCRRPLLQDGSYRASISIRPAPRPG